MTQVTAFFQWCNYLTDQVTAIGKEPLYVNLDETPIPVSFTHVRGNVIRTDRRDAPRQTATRSDTRLYFTLVALICTEPALQPLLPQVILVSDKALRAQDEAAVQASLPDNVYLLRRKSGWNNKETQAEIVALTKVALGAHLERYQVIWLSDACKAHMAPEVMAAIADAGFWYCMVPANLTWLLQPLDVVTFVMFKRFSKQEFMESLGGPHAQPVVVRMIAIVVRGVRRVLQGHAWRRAFAYVGAMGEQDQLARTLAVELSWEAVPNISRERPAQREIELCLPRGFRMPDAAHVSCMPTETSSGDDSADGSMEHAVDPVHPSGSDAAASAPPSLEFEESSEPLLPAPPEARYPAHCLRQKTRSWTAPPCDHAMPETPP